MKTPRFQQHRGRFQQRGKKWMSGWSEGFHYQCFQYINKYVTKLHELKNYCTENVNICAVFNPTEGHCA